MSKNIRKVVSGPQRNAERTKEELISAIGDVLAEDSYSSLSIAHVAKVSKKNPKLLYLYFQDLQGLISAFFQKKLKGESIADLSHAILNNLDHILLEDVMFYIEQQYTELLKDKEWQGLLHWSAGKSDKALQELVKQQNELLTLLRSVVNKTADKRLWKEETIDEIVLITAGLRYLAIYTKGTERPFFGLDLNDPVTQERLKVAVNRLVVRS
ncbi:TetR/AcrR family transcriptional regulator [Sphingobacterium suaedae]|uniref:TetR/AcrR family transcriptional regulator n=1 Tax=Sphingobacterium suaedae TaxID=1686402 RepID=A0ABW5KKJ2_9SPHI